MKKRSLTSDQTLTAHWQNAETKRMADTLRAAKEALFLALGRPERLDGSTPRKKAEAEAAFLDFQIANASISRGVIPEKLRKLIETMTRNDAPYPVRVTETGGMVVDTDKGQWNFNVESVPVLLYEYETLERAGVQRAPIAGKGNNSHRLDCVVLKNAFRDAVTLDDWKTAQAIRQHCTEFATDFNRIQAEVAAQKTAAVTEPLRKPTAPAPLRSKPAAKPPRPKFQVGERVRVVKRPELPVFQVVSVEPDAISAGKNPTIIYRLQSAKSGDILSIQREADLKRAKSPAKPPLLAKVKKAADATRAANAAKKKQTVSTNSKTTDSMKTTSSKGKARKGGKGSASSSVRKAVKRIKGEKVTPKKKKETFLQKMKRAEKIHKASATGKFKQVPVYAISMAKAKRQVLAGK